MFMNGEAEDLTGWTLNEASQKPVKLRFNIVNEQLVWKLITQLTKFLEKAWLSA